MALTDKMRYDLFQCISFAIDHAAAVERRPRTRHDPTTNGHVPRYMTPPEKIGEFLTQLRRFSNSCTKPIIDALRDADLWQDIGVPSQSKKWRLHEICRKEVVMATQKDIEHLCRTALLKNDQSMRQLAASHALAMLRNDVEQMNASVQGLMSINADADILLENMLRVAIDCEST